MADQASIARLGERLHPLLEASAEWRARALAAARVQRFKAGSTVFREGQRDDDVAYLIEGSLDSTSAGQHLKRIDADTPLAAMPLPDRQPRSVTVEAITDVAILYVPRRVLGPLLEHAATSEGMVVRDIDEASETGDWMTMLLRAPLYAQLPAANVHRIVAALETQDVTAGQTIIAQGDIGSCFYVLALGRARITRRVRPGEAEVQMGELREGMSFGEESLVAGIPHETSVVMSTPGRLMQLSREVFETQILHSILHRLSWVEAETRIRHGAVWLDVRLPAEHERDGLDGSINIPLGTLRMRLGRLQRQTPYVVYCDNGQRSAAGAFILASAGFDVGVLDGGITTPDFVESLQVPGAGPASGPRGAIPPEDETEATQPLPARDVLHRLRNTIDALEADKEALGAQLREALATLEQLRLEHARELEALRARHADEVARLRRLSRQSPPG